MSPRLVIGIIALGGVSISGIASAVTSMEMVDKVNAALPDSKQFSPSGWYLAKTLRLHRQYRRLFPDGYLLRGFRIAVTATILCLMVCAWTLTFISW